MPKSIVVVSRILFLSDIFILNEKSLSNAFTHTNAFAVYVSFPRSPHFPFYNATHTTHIEEKKKSVYVY